MKGSKIENLIKWRTSDQWSEENHSPALNMASLFSKTQAPTLIILTHTVL